MNHATSLLGSPDFLGLYERTHRLWHFTDIGFNLGVKGILDREIGYLQKKYIQQIASALCECDRL